MVQVVQVVQVQVVQVHLDAVHDTGEFEHCGLGGGGLAGHQGGVRHLPGFVSSQDYDLFY